MDASALKQFVTRFTPFTAEAWTDFSGLFSETALEAQQFFARHGRVEDRIGFLLQGICRAYVSNDCGEEYNKTFFIAGDMFGAYASLVNQSPNQICIQALTDCKLLSASYQSLVELYKKHACIETFSRRLSEQFYIVKERREIELVQYDASVRYRRFEQEYPGMDQIIPQYHIAKYLGITPTQLSRIRRNRMG